MNTGRTRVPTVRYVKLELYSLAISCVAVKRHLSARCVDQVVLDLFHDLHGASRVHILAFRFEFNIALKIALHDENLERKLRKINQG